jgi:MFS family permease
MDGFGVNLAISANLVSAFVFGGTILQPPLGYLSDRRGYGFAQAVCAVAILAAGVISIVAGSSIWLLFPALFLMGGAAGGLNTLAVIQAGKELDRPRIPAAMAAIAMLYTMGSIAGPVISGAMIELPVKSAMILEFMTIATILLIVMAVQPRRIYRDA